MRKFDKGTNLEFKKDLSNIELKGIEAILDNMGNEDNDGNDFLYSLNHEHYGLAYTSSGDHAMYNVTSEVAIDVDSNDHEVAVSYIAITTNDMLVMVAYDVYDNTHYYEIENSDFY